MYAIAISVVNSSLRGFLFEGSRSGVASCVGDERLQPRDGSASPAKHGYFPVSKHHTHEIFVAKIARGDSKEIITWNIYCSIVRMGTTNEYVCESIARA